ncbi:MAG: cupin domain-containing protein [Chloroflexi bacterium]|nr:cupin domain-containing protein [Chloroflexota bacterium]
MTRAISITEAIAALPGTFQPKDLVTVNQAIVRVARLEGEFPWHQHDEDELFVVPRHTQHRPVAESTAHTLLLERPETLQYGNDQR